MDKSRVKKTMASQPDVELLVQQLKDAMDLTRSLSKSLQDEVLLNAKARIEFKKDIEHLCEVVTELRKIYSGNGQPSLEIRLMQIEKDLETMQEKRTTETERRIKKSERFWKFIGSNSPVILTWIGLAIWAIVQVVLSAKGQIPTPTP